jgi:hypothetical protein
MGNFACQNRQCTELCINIMQINHVFARIFDIHMESRIDSSAAEAEQKAQADTPSSSSSPIAIVIHGGAGTILKKNLTDEMQAQYHATLKLSVETGHAVLKAGGAAHGAFVRSCLSLTVRVCGFAYIVIYIYIYIYTHTHSTQRPWWLPSR